MSFHAINAALALSGLDVGEKFLLVVLGSYANTDNTLWPSQVTLAEDTGMGVRTVARHLDSLETRGLIKRDKRYANHARTSDFITLLFVPAKLAVTVPAKKSSLTGQKVQPVPAKLAGNPVNEPIREPARASPRDPEDGARALEERAEIGRMMGELAQTLRGGPRRASGRR